MARARHALMASVHGQAEPRRVPDRLPRPRPFRCFPRARHVLQEARQQSAGKRARRSRRPGASGWPRPSSAASVMRRAQPAGRPPPRSSPTCESLRSAGARRACIYASTICTMSAPAAKRSWISSFTATA
jgi:hypothetical protein